MVELNVGDNKKLGGMKIIDDIDDHEYNKNIASNNFYSYDDKEEPYRLGSKKRKKRKILTDINYSRSISKKNSTFSNPKQGLKRKKGKNINKKLCEKRKKRIENLHYRKRKKKEFQAPKYSLFLHRTSSNDNENNNEKVNKNNNNRNHNNKINSYFKTTYSTEHENLYDKNKNNNNNNSNKLIINFSAYNKKKNYKNKNNNKVNLDNKAYYYYPPHQIGFRQNEKKEDIFFPSKRYFFIPKLLNELHGKKFEEIIFLKNFFKNFSRMSLSFFGSMKDFVKKNQNNKNNNKKNNNKTNNAKMKKENNTIIKNNIMEKNGNKSNIINGNYESNNKRVKNKSESNQKLKNKNNNRIKNKNNRKIKMNSINNEKIKNNNNKTHKNNEKHINIATPCISTNELRYINKITVRKKNKNEVPIATSLFPVLVTTDVITFSITAATNTTNTSTTATNTINTTTNALTSTPFHINTLNNETNNKKSIVDNKKDIDAGDMNRQNFMTEKSIKKKRWSGVMGDDEGKEDGEEKKNENEDENKEEENGETDDEKGIEDENDDVNEDEQGYDREKDGEKNYDKNNKKKKRDAKNKKGVEKNDKNGEKENDDIEEENYYSGDNKQKYFHKKGNEDERTENDLNNVGKKKRAYRETQPKRELAKHPCFQSNAAVNMHRKRERISDLNLSSNGSCSSSGLSDSTTSTTYYRHNYTMMSARKSFKKIDQVLIDKFKIEFRFHQKSRWRLLLKVPGNQTNVEVTLSRLNVLARRYTSKGGNKKLKLRDIGEIRSSGKVSVFSNSNSPTSKKFAKNFTQNSSQSPIQKFLSSSLVKFYLIFFQKLSYNFFGLFSHVLSRSDASKLLENKFKKQPSSTFSFQNLQRLIQKNSFNMSKRGKNFITKHSERDAINVKVGKKTIKKRTLNSVASTLNNHFTPKGSFQWKNTKIKKFKISINEKQKLIKNEHKNEKFEKIIDSTRHRGELNRENWNFSKDKTKFRFDSNKKNFKTIRKPSTKTHNHHKRPANQTNKTQPKKKPTNHKHPNIFRTKRVSQKKETRKKQQNNQNNRSMNLLPIFETPYLHPNTMLVQLRVSSVARVGKHLIIRSTQPVLFDLGTLGVVCRGVDFDCWRACFS